MNLSRKAGLVVFSIALGSIFTFSRYPAHDESGDGDMLRPVAEGIESPPLVVKSAAETEPWRVEPDPRRPPQQPIDSPVQKIVRVDQLPEDQRKLFDSFNFLLARDGCPVIPEDAFIASDELPVFLEESRKSMGATNAAHSAWMDAVSARGTEFVRSLEAALAVGKPVPLEWRAFPADGPNPTIDGPFDLVSIHVRPGDPLKYALFHPAHMFNQEIRGYREARQAQLSLFLTLRQLFQYPQPTPTPTSLTK